MFQVGCFQPRRKLGRSQRAAAAQRTGGSGQRAPSAGPSGGGRPGGTAPPPPRSTCLPQNIRVAAGEVAGPPARCCHLLVASMGRVRAGWRWHSHGAAATPQKAAPHHQDASHCDLNLLCPTWPRSA